MKEKNQWRVNWWMNSIQRSNFGLTDKEIELLINYVNTTSKTKPKEIKEEPTNDYQYILIAI